MKASDKPTKPTPPREPVRPTKVYLEAYRASVYVCTGQSLASLLSEMTSIGQATGGGRRATGLPAFDQIMTAYGGSDAIDLVWDQEVEVTLTDDQFAAATAKYEAAMEIYWVKLRRHESELISYEVELMRWEQEVKRRETERELTELARLKAKHEQAS